ncbi:MAG: septal ring lytic transglycosylase RlpA family protein [Pseudomonadota bacterium]
MSNLFRFLILLIITSCSSTSNWQPSSGKSYNFRNASGYGGYYKIGGSYLIQGKKYHPEYNPSYEEVGIASWYGPNFHGKLTANGERYNQRALTAAHRTLPMPSMVKVTNLNNGREIIVMVNDRGPFAHDRIIDISEYGAELLDFKQKGTSKVKVEYLPYETELMLKKFGLYDSYVKVTKQQPKPMLARIDSNQSIAKSGKIFVQLGAFSDFNNARRELVKYQNVARGTIKQKATADSSIFKVQLGPYNKFTEAQKMLNKIRELGNNQAMIVANN